MFFPKENGELSYRLSENESIYIKKMTYHKQFGVKLFDPFYKKVFAVIYRKGSDKFVCSNALSLKTAWALVGKLIESPEKIQEHIKKFNKEV